jgi:hypothetical protein
VGVDSRDPAQLDAPAPPARSAKKARPPAVGHGDKACRTARPAAVRGRQLGVQIQARTVKDHDYSTAHQGAAAPETTASLPMDKGPPITGYRHEQHWHAGVQDRAPDRARPFSVEVLRPAQGDEVGLLGARHIHHVLAG